MKNCFVVLAALALTACLGTEAGIDIKRNGSGTIDMAYRISNEMFMLGTTPGNESSPSLPVGKEDFERTFSRITGMEMTSYSEKEDERDRIFLIKAKFDSLDALVNFLDTHSRKVAIKHEGSATALSIDLSMDNEFIDPDMAPILPVIFNGYYMDFKISLPRDCKVSYTDGNGNKLPALPYGETVAAAKSVSFRAPMADLLSGADAAIMTITW
jgi:hypothetical protein